MISVTVPLLMVCGLTTVLQSGLISTIGRRSTPSSCLYSAHQILVSTPLCRDIATHMNIYGYF